MPGAEHPDRCGRRRRQFSGRFMFRSQGRCGGRCRTDRGRAIPVSVPVHRRGGSNAAGSVVGDLAERAPSSKTGPASYRDTHAQHLGAGGPMLLAPDEMPPVLGSDCHTGAPIGLQGPPRNLARKATATKQGEPGSAPTRPGCHPAPRPVAAPRYSRNLKSSSCIQCRTTHLADSAIRNTAGRGHWSKGGGA